MLRSLGKTGLQLEPLVLGGNVFGWTVDRKRSFELLDAFVDAGLGAIDTADSYSTWVPGHSGGESESIIGEWLAANPAKRSRVLIFTKVGSDLGEDRKGLSARWIARAAEDSLRRLRTDVIDLYQSHWPDPATAYEETLFAYERLLREGKVRAIGASNLNAAQLSQSLAVAKERGLPRYATLQPHYNLYDRDSFEGELRELCVRENIGVISYFGLASGFLTGKYRSAADLTKGPRGAGMAQYLNVRGTRILAALDQVAARLDALPAEVALAWVAAQKGITAPIASATDLQQLGSLIRSVRLRLSAEDLRVLDSASATQPS
ncbi:MAG: aldo/keto reductase [Proteobacteria bacterium]|nr:aldo/keto reductase [Pseudomonadota bacterium]